MGRIKGGQNRYYSQEEKIKIVKDVKIILKILQKIYKNVIIKS